jgi:hypothetical protein
MNPNDISSIKGFHVQPGSDSRTPKRDSFMKPESFKGTNASNDSGFLMKNLEFDNDGCARPKTVEPGMSISERIVGRGM